MRCTCPFFQTNACSFGFFGGASCSGNARPRATIRSLPRGKNAAASIFVSLDTCSSDEESAFLRVGPGLSRGGFLSRGPCVRRAPLRDTRASCARLIPLILSFRTDAPVHRSFKETAVVFLWYRTFFQPRSQTASSRRCLFATNHRFEKFSHWQARYPVTRSFSLRCN